MPEPSPSPEQDDAIRRLLAQARHDEPIPDEIADRLDRVLDGLNAEAAFAETDPDGLGSSLGGSAVVSLDARRKRRQRLTQLLVAAAAVLAIGIGIGRVVGTDDKQPDTATSVQRQPRDGGSAADPSADPGTDSSTDSPTADATGATALGYAQLEPELPFALTVDAFDANVRTAIASSSRLDPTLQDDSPVVAALQEPLPGWTCGTDPAPSISIYGSGVLLPATYDEMPVVLALRPAAGDGIPVEVLECGTATVLRSTVIEAS